MTIAFMKSSDSTIVKIGRILITVILFCSVIGNCWIIAELQLSRDLAQEERILRAVSKAGSKTVSKTAHFDALKARVDAILIEKGRLEAKRDFQGSWALELELRAIQQEIREIKGIRRPV